MLSNKKVVKEQYKDASNLSTRISIHSKYSVNKMGFGNWIISNYEIKKGMRILELGCGTGDMWKNHIRLFDDISEIVLSDFSEGMIKTAKGNLGNHKHVSYKVIDIQEIPFEDHCFDVVIANMMLYHVSDLDKALREVRRVLKTNGTFYAATFGENGIVEYIVSLLKEYRVEDDLDKGFTLQNGEKVLKSYFRNIIKLDYKDALEVTEIEDLIDYAYSLSGISNMSKVSGETMKCIFEREMKDGILRVPKEYGMFICK